MSVLTRTTALLGALAGLATLAVAPSYAAPEEPAAPTAPGVAATTAPAVPALPVVAGAKSLTTEEKKDIDGAMRCARMTFITIYYVLGYEVYRTSEERWVCDPSVN